MPDAGEVTATRVALLELRDERRLINEGYELLDEKRVLLATEILRQLRQFSALEEETAAQWATARQCFLQAVAVHGFEDLTVAPPCPLDAADLHCETRSFLGIPLVQATFTPPAGAFASPPVMATPEVARCAAAFRRIAALAADSAACSGNLRRLAQEYRRTERRARALENILLPEIDGALRFIEEQLDAVDQEEAVRVRNAARER